MRFWIVAYFLIVPLLLEANGDLYGELKNSRNGDAISYARITLNQTTTNETHYTLTDEFGRFYFENIQTGKYILSAKCMFHTSARQEIILKEGENFIKLELEDTNELSKIEIYADESYDSRSMRMIDGLTVTNGKKTQYIDIRKIDGNRSTNNARELYAKVPGLNIWESDGGGLQLGIGTRGLSPSRTAHFNTRQNGYDISADPLGYPETYYSPPADAIQGIQLIRGAASLQFGPQFGGMINFKLRDPSDKPFSYYGAHTYGSFNLLNTFNSISGTLKKRFSYLVYHQYKRGDGWRENGQFSQHQLFGKLRYNFNENIFLSVEHTFMTYLAQQPGGLTDAMFENDPRQSIRDRNWFAVDWNVTALNFGWRVSKKTTIDFKAYKVSARRDALGNLERISRADDGEDRDLIRGDFDNFGSELRLLHKYPIGKKMLGVLATGARYYQGVTQSQQGKADSTHKPNFSYNNPDHLEGSDFQFPSQNISAFAEHILWINKKFSISAGVRYEFINTSSDGYYREMVYHPLTEALIFDTTYYDNSSNKRSIVVAGLGFSARPANRLEIYGNIAQNYRAINFSDIRILNPNQIVDPDIQDEKGFNADLGLRGQNKKGIFDVSAFFLYYDNKIGVINQKLNDYDFVRLRTNVGNAYSTGLELFGEKRFKRTDSSKFSFSVYGNLSVVYSRYGVNDETAISQNWVELVPPVVFRGGFKVRYSKVSSSISGSYVHKHYTDGTNAEFDPSAVAGIIPSYYVMDFNLTYAATSYLSLKGGVNNFTNNKYFTRRATSYPGPGIIPSDGINFYLTLQISL